VTDLFWDFNLFVLPLQPGIPALAGARGFPAGRFGRRGRLLLFLQHNNRIRIYSIPDTGSASKNLSILTKKNGSQALENMIRVVQP
jgi:hypothetical protein